MKYFLAISVFILGLAMGVKSVASSGQSSGHEDQMKCLPNDNNTKCA